jgi:DNA replication protein DnaC
MAAIETRLQQAQAERMAPIDLITLLVSDEISRRAGRLLERRTKEADRGDAERTLNSFDFDFNRNMNRRLIYDLVAGEFINRREDALFLGPDGGQERAGAHGQSIMIFKTLYFKP